MLCYTFSYYMFMYMLNINSGITMWCKIIQKTQYQWLLGDLDLVFNVTEFVAVSRKGTNCDLWVWETGAEDWSHTYSMPASLKCQKPFWMSENDSAEILALYKLTWLISWLINFISVNTSVKDLPNIHQLGTIHFCQGHIWC